MRNFISGFPGVGKTYLAGSQYGYVDSDSSKFPKEGFPGNYLDAITSDGKKHFVSSHELVRNELKIRRIPYLLVYPDKSLHDEYMQRYRDRKSPEAFINMVSANWDAWITSCEDDLHPLVTQYTLTSGQYLADIPW